MVEPGASGGALDERGEAKQWGWRQTGMSRCEPLEALCRFLYSIWMLPTAQRYPESILIPKAWM